MADENNVMNIELQAEDKASPKIDNVTISVNKLNEALKTFMSLKPSDDRAVWKKAYDSVNKYVQQLNGLKVDIDWGKSIGINIKDIEKQFASFQHRMEKGPNTEVLSRKPPAWFSSKQDKWDWKASLDKGSIETRTVQTPLITTDLAKWKESKDIIDQSKKTLEDIRNLEDKFHNIPVSSSSNPWANGLLDAYKSMAETQEQITAKAKEELEMKVEEADVMKRESDYNHAMKDFQRFHEMGTGGYEKVLRNEIYERERARSQWQDMAASMPEAFLERSKSGEFASKLESPIAKLSERFAKLVGNLKETGEQLEEQRVKTKENAEAVTAYNDSMAKSADLRAKWLGTLRNATKSSDKELAAIGEKGLRDLNNYQASQGRLRNISAKFTDAESKIKNAIQLELRQETIAAGLATRLREMEIANADIEERQKAILDKEKARKKEAEDRLALIREELKAYSEMSEEEREQKYGPEEGPMEAKGDMESLASDYQKEIEDANYNLEHPEEIEEYRNLAEDLKLLNQEMDKYSATLNELEKNIEILKKRLAGVTEETEDGAEGFETYRNNAEEAARGAEENFNEADRQLHQSSELQRVYGNISQTLNLASGSMSNFASSLASVGTAGGANPIILGIAAALKVLKFAIDQVGQGFKRMISFVTKSTKLIGGVFKTATSKAVKIVGSLAKSFVTMGSSAVTKTISKPFELLEKGFKSVSSWIAMLKTRIKRRIVAEMFEDLTGTLATMAEQRDEFNESVSSMVTSLRVLGAQIIAIVQPIIEIFAPALEYVARLMTGLADKISQFTARLNGQNEYFKASDGVYDFAEAMKSASGDTQEATKSAKAYENTVMGFDQLNKLNGKNDSSSASKTTSLANPVNLKKALTQATALNKLADKIRRAFKNKDFKNAGKYVAEAVNDAFSWLDKVAGWEKNADKIKGFMGGVIDFTNGFLEGLDPEVIGHSIGDVLNSGIEAIKMLTDPETGVNFELLGSRLGEILQNAIKTIKWEDAGAAFMQTIQAFVRTAVGFLETPGLFEDIGTAFRESLSGAIDAFKPEDWSDMIAGVVNGMSDFMINAFSEKDATEAGSKLADTINLTWEKVDKDKLSSGIANFIRSLSALALSLLKDTDWGNILGDFVVTLSDSISKIFTDDEGLVKAFEDPSGMIKIFEEPSDENDLFRAAEEKGESLGSAITNGFNAFAEKIENNKDKIVNSIVMSIKAIMSAIGTVLTTSDWAELLATLINGFFEGMGKLFEDADKARQFGEDLSAQVRSFFDNLDAEKIATGVNNFTDSMNAFIDGLFNSETMDSIKHKLGEVMKLIDWADIMELSWNLSNAGITTRLATLMSGSIRSAIEQSLPGGDTEIGKIAYESIGNIGIHGLTPVRGAISQTIDIGRFLLKKVKGFFANGGEIGDGQLFIANEHGAEAITRGDGGRTIITNNQQMVQAVSSGVRSAVLEAMRMSQGNNNNNGGDIVLYVDSEELARASLRGQRSLDKRLNPVIQFA